MPHRRLIRPTLVTTVPLVLSLLCGNAAAKWASFDFSASDGGFAAAGTTDFGLPWAWSGGGWEVPGSDKAFAGTSTLASPVVTAGGSALTLSFTHRWDFEALALGPVTSFLDGGNVRVRINDGAEQIVGSDIGSFTSNGYNATLASVTNPLQGEPAFGGTNGPLSSSATLSGLSAGDAVVFLWTAGWDGTGNAPAPNWTLSSVQIDGVQGGAAPLPATPLLLGLGLGGLVAVRCRRARNRTA